MYIILPLLKNENKPIWGRLIRVNARMGMRINELTSLDLQDLYLIIKSSKQLQRNSTLIAALHLKVTVRPLTPSKNLHLTVSSRRPLAPV